VRVWISGGSGFVGSHLVHAAFLNDFTRLDATATAAALGVELPDLDTQLAQLERTMTQEVRA
jgi:nucleoside-diphosphate-sugar epimerase